MKEEKAIYDFDEADPTLTLLPTAARRALDLGGQKLSLEGWRSLSQADRAALVSAGALGVVDPETVRAVVVRATPPAQPVAPMSDPDRTTPPAHLVSALAPERSVSDAAWAELRPLDRYALAKVASRGRADRLGRAFDEVFRRELSHVNAAGEAHMVDVADKAPTRRRAVASARVTMLAETLARLLANDTPKGDVLAAARIAGIQAAKRTPELIPLCHVVALTKVEIELSVDREACAVDVRAVAEAVDRTGVEMEAMVAASTAALTIYDMLKAIDRWMKIDGLALLEKSGGRSGTLVRGDR